MPSTPSYSETLSRCEAELQQLASDAMAKGEYDSARRGLELAEQVAGLYKSIEAAPAKPAAKKSSTTSPAPRKAKQSKAKKTPKLSSASIKPFSAKAYPKFARDDDKLIKIGWSKRTREEYEHKTPRAAIDAFVKHLRKNTEEGRIFTVDDLTPVPDPLNDGELPSYQVYMGIAWLRSLDVISKHGRNGYSVEKSMISNKALAESWDKLPSNKQPSKG